MQMHRALSVARIFLVALVITPLFVGRGRAQGTAYLGKFTLTQQIRWGKSSLPPGHYTLTIVSSSSPVIVKVQNEGTGESFRVVTSIHEEKTSGVNGLFLQAKNGQQTVHSLSVPEIGMVFIYEPVLANKPVLETQASQIVPVQLAKM